MDRWISSVSNKLEKMYTNNDTSLSFVPYSNAIYPKWSSSNFLVANVHGKWLDYAMCLNCKKFFYHVQNVIIQHAKHCKAKSSIIFQNKSNRQDGTITTPNGQDGYHRDIDSSSNGQHSNNEENDKKRIKTEKNEDIIPLDNVSTIKRSLILLQNFVSIRDFRDVSITLNKSFLDYAQFLINIGSKKCALPKTEHYLREQFIMIAKRRAAIQQMFLSKESYSMSSDIWVNRVRKRVHVSLSVHHSDSDFDQHNILIGMKSFLGEVYTPKEIYKQFLLLLGQFGSSEEAKTILQNATAFLTTDRNIAKFMIAHTRNPSICACSVINEIVNEFVNRPYLNVKELYDQVSTIIKKIHPHFIKTDPSKWENVYNLLSMFLEARLLLSKNEIDGPLVEVQQFMQILHPFYIAIKNLTSDNKGSKISEVYIYYKMLEKHLKPNNCGTDMINIAKKAALTDLYYAFPNLELYQMCMIIDPRSKSHITTFTSFEIIKLKKMINELIHKKTPPLENSNKVKLSEKNSYEYTEYMDDNVMNNSIEIAFDPESELERFLKLPPSEELNFWKNATTTFPQLRNVARIYLSIPTYSSESQILFSERASSLLSQRNDLEIKDLETMLIMNSAFNDTS